MIWSHDQWLCSCGTANIFFRKRCRACGQLQTATPPPDPRTLPVHPPMQFYSCPVCTMRTFNPIEVGARYCSNCKIFGSQP